MVVADFLALDLHCWGFLELVLHLDVMIPQPQMMNHRMMVQ
jgi:hypothetical protein